MVAFLPFDKTKLPTTCAGFLRSEKILERNVFDFTIPGFGYVLSRSYLDLRFMKTEKKALLVMDIQHTQMGYIPDATPLLNTIVETIQFARESGIPVIYVAVSFREGYPELKEGNHIFGSIMNSNGIFTAGNDGTNIHPAVAPLPGEIVVYKKRVSAFAGNDLELILRSQNITSLILTGFASSGVVLSTLRDAADRDYDLTVLSDACADPDPAVHEFLINRIFPFSGKVMTTAQFKNQL